MAKLGYTWYPKDWGNSDSVFELSLCERGLYREFIDFAMLNDNKTEIKKDVWLRKFSVSINELNLILDKLLLLNLIEIKENILWLTLSNHYSAKKNLLLEQVNELKKIDYNINFVYMKNSEMKLDDTKL